MANFFIDIDPLAQPSLTGVGKVTELLANELSKRLSANGHDIDLVYADPLNRRRVQIDRDLVAKNEHVRLVRARLMFRRVYGKLLKYHIAPPFNWLMPTTKRYQAAIYPNFARFPMLPGARSFTVVHDLTFVHHPEYVEAKNQPYLQSVVPAAIRKSEKIITISATVKQEIVDHFGIAPEKVMVLPLIPSLATKLDTGILTKLKLETKRYIVFVGTLEPRKNLGALLDAYLKLPETTRSEVPLVLVGPEGWKEEELLRKIKLAQDAGSKVITTGFVTEPEKAALFANAAVFVLPAYYEGFGIPPTEALSVGCPVIASDIPVLREVLGDAALYCDPHQPETIATHLQTLLGSEALQRDYSKRGPERIKQLAKQCMAACDELAALMEAK